jgi:hypothetical protein
MDDLDHLPLEVQYHNLRRLVLCLLALLRSQVPLVAV